MLIQINQQTDKEDPKKTKSDTTRKTLQDTKVILNIIREYF